MADAGETVCERPQSGADRVQYRPGISRRVATACSLLLSTRWRPQAEQSDPATNSPATRSSALTGEPHGYPFHAGASAPRNRACDPHAASLPASAVAPPVPPGSSRAALHPGLIEHPDLTPEVQVALLAAVDEAAIAELGDLAGVIPDNRGRSRPCTPSSTPACGRSTCRRGSMPACRSGG